MSLRRLASSLFVVLSFSACEKKPTESAPPAASASASTVAPAASSAAPAKTGVEAEITAVAKRWNDALSARNAEDLRKIYGAHPRLYGVRMTRDQAVKGKAAALAAAPDYTQTLVSPSAALRDARRPVLKFKKTWTTGGKTSEVLASLAFAREDGAWVIVDESDAKSDAKRAHADAGGPARCEDAVTTLVASTSEAKSFLNGPVYPGAGHISNGLQIGSGPPESPTYSVGVHENHEDRLVTLAWFEVDPKTGVVSQEDVATQDLTTLKADPALQAKVRAACAGH